MKSSIGAAPNAPSPSDIPAPSPQEEAGYEVLRQHTQYLTTADSESVRAAFEVSRAAHAGQFRKSGEPYILHPLAVAGILAGWHLDPQALCAALLHDVVEDTETSNADIQARFGPSVAMLV